MKNRTTFLRMALAGTAIALLALPTAAEAAGRQRQIVVEAADPTEQGDGTLGAAARRAMNRGALPRSAAEVAAKAAVTATSRKAGPASSSLSAEAGVGKAARATISGGHNFAGQFSAGSTPPDTTGAVGTTRFIQLVNRRFGIYNKATHAIIGQGTLNQLAGLAPTVNTFDPQIIWDAQTSRFYYMNDSIFSATDNRLSFGFSKTASPRSAADFCHYTFRYGSEFPDYPKLGDSQHFIIAGVNTFVGNSFVGSDLVAISKPPAGTACPPFASFRTGAKFGLEDTDGDQVFTPVPANEIDTDATGYVVARDGTLPATALWFFNVTRNAATGNPVFGNARGLSVGSYTFPPNAPAGVGTNRLLDTLDARNTQAVAAINPDRDPTAAKGTSFWTQHTIKHRNQDRSVVRWYEIDPVPDEPRLRRSAQEIGNATPDTFFFNAAISPDRRVNGATRQFGDNAVIGYSVTRSGSGGINPRITAGSTINGGPLANFIILKDSAGPYVDFSCAGAAQTCRWGDYSASTPDPAPGAVGSPARGVVWHTNQWTAGGTSTAQANWRTQITAIRP